MDPRARALARARDHSYGIVLLLVLASASFEVAAPDADWSSLITVLLAAATLLASVWAAHARHRVVQLATGIVLAVAAFAVVKLVARGSIPDGAYPVTVVALIVSNLARFDARHPGAPPT